MRSVSNPWRQSCETLALPKKIVMVSDGRNSGFGNKFGQRDTQGNVDRNGRRILHHQNLKFEPVAKLLQGVFQRFFDGMNFLGDLPASLFLCKQRTLYLENLRVSKEGFQGKMGGLLRCVGFAGHVIDPAPLALEYVSPFLGFQRNADGNIESVITKT